MEEQNVYDWLNDYTQKLDQMSLKEKTAERRDEYHEDSQAYADYLDYLDEWEWYTKDQKSYLIENAIALFSKSHQQIMCDCGNNHTLTTQLQHDQGDIIVDDPQKLIFTQCWYKTISKQASEVLEGITSDQIRMPYQMESMLTSMISWKVESSLNEKFLPLEAFKQLWWNKDRKGRETVDSQVIQSQISPTEKNKLLDLHRKSVNVTKEAGKRVLLHYVYDEHSFHNFALSLSKADFRDILSFINYWRCNIGRPDNKINIVDVQNSMAKCAKCQEQKFKPCLTLPGIYYAPPGAGKTTAQEKGYIVGLDTDWIGVGLDWTDYSYVLRKKIPIITNQYTAFEGCCVRIVGVIKSNIRKDAKGKTFTTKEVLEAYQRKHKREVIFLSISERKYFSHYAIQMQMHHLLQHMIQNYSINQMPFYQTTHSEEWRELYPKLMRKEKFLRLAKQNVDPDE